MVSVANMVVYKSEYIWERMDDEPWLWFQRFTNYFLPLGPGRTMLGAYTAMVNVEQPAIADARKKKKEADPKHRTPNGVSFWSKAALEWHWRERSKAFDNFAYKGAQAHVELARLTLLESSNKAAEALVAALSNERLKVAAAKEILDRAGLPGTTNINLGVADKFSADELRAAEDEIADWETSRPKPKQISESNG